MLSIGGDRVDSFAVPNRSTDTISEFMHATFSHLDNKVEGGYFRLLFIGLVVIRLQNCIYEYATPELVVVVVHNKGLSSSLLMYKSQWKM